MVTKTESVWWAIEAKNRDAATRGPSGAAGTGLARQERRLIRPRPNHFRPHAEPRALEGNASPTPWPFSTISSHPTSHRLPALDCTTTVAPPPFSSSYTCVCLHNSRDLHNPRHAEPPSPVNGTPPALSPSSGQTLSTCKQSKPTHHLPPPSSPKPSCAFEPP